jgi:hypothetical protein
MSGVSGPMSARTEEAEEVGKSENTEILKY